MKRQLPVTQMESVPKVNVAANMVTMEMVRRCAWILMSVNTTLVWSMRLAQTTKEAITAHVMKVMNGME